jgi:hypothetical protein
MEPACSLRIHNSRLIDAAVRQVNIVSVSLKVLNNKDNAVNIFMIKICFLV